MKDNLLEFLAFLGMATVLSLLSCIIMANKIVAYILIVIMILLLSGACIWWYRKR